MLLNHARLLIGMMHPASSMTHLRKKKLDIDPESINWSCFDKQSSPSRLACDLFWSYQDWEYINIKLGPQISALDIGCGTGIYLEKLISYGAKFDYFNGFDIQKCENWKILERKYSFAKFTEAKSSDIKALIDRFKPNLIYSQSCLEHLDNDKYIIDTISEYAISTQKRIIQFHLVPSMHCLWLYGGHGIRIYTLPILEKLIQSVDIETSLIELYELGGKACFKAHKNYVGYFNYSGSVGRDLRTEKPKEYWTNLKKAVVKDIVNPSPERANFYALKILHNF